MTRDRVTLLSVFIKSTFTKMAIDKKSVFDFLPPNFKVTYERISYSHISLNLYIFLLIAILSVCTHFSQATAQSIKAAIKVNDLVITQYELDQRIRFLGVLGGTGDLEETAKKDLINDRLAQQEAKRIGYKPDEDSIILGMEEFAGRANLSAEEFINILAENGISRQTFRDFVKNGVIWRELSNARIAPSVSVSNKEIDLAITNTILYRSVGFFLSEIILPVNQNPEKVMLEASKIAAQINSKEDFIKAVKRYSVSPTATKGGKLEWIAASSLPPEITSAILSSNPNKTTEPIFLGDAVGLFQIHSISENLEEAPPPFEVEYLTFALPYENEIVKDVIFEAEQNPKCADFFTRISMLKRTNSDLGIEDPVIKRELHSDLSPDISLVLARLDTGEFTTKISRFGKRNFFMMCKRIPKREPPIERDQVIAAIRNEKIVQGAAIWLEQLHSEAVIVDVR